MSFLIAAPEALAAASEHLSGIGSSIQEATSAAAPSTTSVVAAAEDEISAAISKLFGGYGQEFQALSAQAGLFHSSFVQALTSGGGVYAAAEAASRVCCTNVVDLAGAVRASSRRSEAITGRSLFVNGATGTAGTAASPMAVPAGPADGLAATAAPAAPASAPRRRGWR